MTVRSVNIPTADKSFATESPFSTQASTVGVTKSSARLFATAKVADKTLSTSTFFSFIRHAVETIYTTFCHILYFGLFFFTASMRFLPHRQDRMQAQSASNQPRTMKKTEMLLSFFLFFLSCFFWYLR